MRWVPTTRRGTKVKAGTTIETSNSSASPGLQDSAEGRPAAQLVYNTDNKAIGPLTLIIGSSKEADIPPTLARRQDVNLLYWRHQGRAYALVGQTDIGYLWGIANDVAWQLDAI